MWTGALPVTTRPCVVADAGPLIHLDELGVLDLLADFEAVYVAPIVWGEVLRHRPGICSTHPWLRQSAPIASSTGSFDALVRTLVLHRGEVSALLLCKEKHADLFLSDDSAARLAGQALGFRVHGTLGILLRSMRRGLRAKAQVVATLRAIPDNSTLRIRPALLEEIIATADRYHES